MEDPNCNDCNHKNKNLVQPDPTGVKILSELGKIGSNLNQIAKALNTDPKFTQEQKKGLNQIFKQFEEIKKKLQV